MNLYRIITSKGLKSQDLIDDDKVIYTVKDPVSSIEPSIFEQLIKQTEMKPIAVGYDNTFAFLPEERNRFPAASMNHFFLADSLSKNTDVRNAKSLVDLGCGAGFLGNYAAKNFEGLENGKIIFGDLFPESINAALIAYFANNELDPREMQITQYENSISVRGKGKQVVEFRIGDVTQTMFKDKADLAVASPIYIPEICEVFPEAFELFGAVSKNIGADFYVAHSSLADKVIERAASVTGAKLSEINSQKRPLDLSVTDSRRRTLDEEVIAKLLPMGLIVEKQGDKVSYQHELRVSKLSYK